MKIKINEKVLSLPPYISTAWKNIISLRVVHRHKSVCRFGCVKASGFEDCNPASIKSIQAGLQSSNRESFHASPNDKNFCDCVLESLGGNPLLIIELVSGSRVAIPHLDTSLIEQIFIAHTLSLEHKEPQKAPEAPSFTIPINFLPGTLLPGMEGISPLLQHNLEQGNSPDLPRDLLDKMVEMAKSVGIQDISSLPKAEPHCNCPHCQIMRAFHTSAEAPLPEEEVTPEDLTFRSWDIEQNGEQLYTVTNPLAKEEHYSVFLGNPIGCTCGQKNCEHIQAVLHS